MQHSQLLLFCFDEYRMRSFIQQTSRRPSLPATDNENGQFPPPVTQGDYSVSLIAGGKSPEGEIVREGTVRGKCPTLLDNAQIVDLIPTGNIFTYRGRFFNNFERQANVG